MPKIFFSKGSERAKSAGRRGGMVMTDRKRFMNALNARKWCRPNCVIYRDCPFMVASEKKFKGKCALKQMPQEIQNWTVDILLNGSEGMINSMKSMLLDILIEAKSSNMRDKVKALYAIKDVHEAAYGKFVRQETTGSQEMIVKFKDPYKKREKNSR